MGLDSDEAGGAGRDRTGYGGTRRTGQDMAERDFVGQGMVAVQAAGGAGRGTRQDGTARDKQWDPAPTFFHGAAVVNENLSKKF